MPIVSYLAGNGLVASGFDCEPTFVEKCLPSLTILGQSGIHHFTAMIRVLDSQVLSCWPGQDFLHHRDELSSEKVAAVLSAISNLLDVVEAAIDTLLADDEDGECVLDSCYLYVTVERESGEPGWRIHCDVSSVVADDYPNLALRLR